MMKKNDIVKFALGVEGNMQEGRVNWVANGNVGITLTGEGYSGHEATVLPEEDCTVVVEFKGDDLKAEIHDLSTEELIASIQRLKGMRLPKKASVRHVRVHKESKKDKIAKLLKELEGDPEALDALIAKALDEDEEVKP